MDVRYAIGISVSGLIVELTIFFITFYVNDSNINDDIKNFRFSQSVSDLVIIQILKTILLLGIICGVIIRHERVKRKLLLVKQIMLYFSLIIILYLIMKCLYFAEQNEKNITRWILLTCTMASIVTFNIYTRIIAKSKNLHNKSSSLFHTYEELDNQDKEKVSTQSEIDKAEAAKIPIRKVLLFMIKMTKEDRVYLIFAMLGIIIWAIAQSLYPLYAGNVINYIAIEKSPKKFKESLILLALVIIFTGIGASFRAGFFTYFEGSYMLRIQKKLLESIVNMEIGFFDVRQTGEITSRLTTDCTKLSESLSFNLQLLIADVFNIIGVLIFSISISWKLSLIALLRIPLLLVITEGFGEKYEALSQQLLSSLAIANASAEESISNIRTVRSFAAEKNELDTYCTKLSGTYKIIKQKCFIAAKFWAATDSAGLMIQLLVFIYGGHLIIINEIQPAHLISFIFYTNQLNESFHQISFIYTGVMEGVGAARNIVYYIERKSQIIKRDTEVIKGNIKFDHVTFSYPSRPETEVLKDINFEIREGEVAAFVGSSGAGKSSITNLLERFYKPTQGNIYIDNTLLQEYDHKSIHQQISIVQQEPVLFARTIKNNINYATDSQYNYIDTENAANMANATDFIQSFKEGFETEVGERGIQLSGGQKQRLAIARALIRNPKILILDEATSALDSESEFLVQQAIDKNLYGRTVMIVAHRLSTIQRADKIFVLKDGEIAECGKHEELLEKPAGEYAKLFKRQRDEFDYIQRGTN